MEDCTSKQLNDFAQFIRYLRSMADYGMTESNVQYLLSNLRTVVDNYVSHLTLVHSGTFPTVERLTVNRRVLRYNGRIHEIKHLSYPPSEKVTQLGRCNLPGQSVLYGSFGSLITYSVQKPVKGDVVTISTWNAIDDAKLRFVPICASQPKDGTFNPRLAKFQEAYDSELAKLAPNTSSKIELMNQFIADMFTRPVSKDRHLDYFFSAYFSNLILNEYYEGQVDALYYPSVPMNLSFENLAIKHTTFDSIYKISHVSEGIVDMDYTMSNGSMTIHIAQSSEFHEGKILWEPSRLTKEEIQFFVDTYDYIV